MARPPISEDRLERTDSGDILYKLKSPWSDGTVDIQLSPTELIEKLIALIPPRSSPLVRYGGVFAPNFKRRNEIILKPGRRKRKVLLKPEGAQKSQKRKASSGSWAACSCGSSPSYQSYDWTSIVKPRGGKANCFAIPALKWSLPIENLILKPEILYWEDVNFYENGEFIPE
ncbi:MAG: transposase [Proteobacteria bacterium]|nr:transposase [Pseudomonadota bacterium]